MVTEGVFGSALPITGSHEASGTVVAVGRSVKDFQPGDRVMCGLYANCCGKCGDCRGPEEFSQYCVDNDGAFGVHRDGGFAEYGLVDARHSAKLPDNVSFETAAPLACAGCTAWRGVFRCGLSKGEWLGIVGSGGGLGHLAIQFARALGFKTIGIDARDEGLALSREAGADVVIDARLGNDEVVKQVHAATGDGCPTTLTLSDAKSAAGTACAITRKHGKMVQIAQPETVDIPFAELVFRDIHVEGSLICSPAEAALMLKTVSEHGITVRTNPFQGLKSIPQLIELAHGGKMQGKAIIVVDEEQVKSEKKAGLTLV